MVEKIKTLIPPQDAEQDNQDPISRYKIFLQNIELNSQGATQVTVRDTMSYIERISSNPDRAVKVYTDPKLQTFCCQEVPLREINSKGEIIEDPLKKVYLVGIPFKLVLGRGPNIPDDFYRGGVDHEVGHALWTNWGHWERLRKTAIEEGYDPSEIISLFNCVEDPRMERIVGGPFNPHRQRGLAFFNEVYVVPNISARLPTMTPTKQFKFLLKLEGEWNIHQECFGWEEKIWSLDQVHPSVKEAYERVKQDLLRITGDSKTPPMKNTQTFLEIFLSKIWAEQKKLIDTFPEEKKHEDNKKEGEGEEEEDEEGQVSKKNLKRGSRSQAGSSVKDGEGFNPKDPSTLPEGLRDFIEKMVEQYNREIQQEAEKKKLDLERRRSEIKRLTEENDKLTARQEGYKDPEARKAYEKLKTELVGIIRSINSLFKEYFPKTTEPERTYGRGKLDVKKLSREFNTGNNIPPLYRKETDTVSTFLLQVIVDVSGSMAGEGITSAVKGVISIVEAANDGTNVIVEILASDHQNVGNEGGEKYEIKPFGKELSGREKENIVAMKQMHKFGGDNDDSESLRVAYRRFKERQTQERNQFKANGLIIFITDSTTPDTKMFPLVESIRREGTPVEGFAITTETHVINAVKKNFGDKTLIPQTVEELPNVLKRIIKRHMEHFSRKY